MSDHQRIHLGYVASAEGNGKAPRKIAGCSGRAVRFRILDAREVAHLRDQAAKEITEHTKNFQYDDLVAESGVCEMIVSYSQPTTPAELGGAPFTLAKPGEVFERKAELFTTKDLELLKQVYLRLHHVNPKEIDDIMGGIVGVVD